MQTLSSYKNFIEVFKKINFNKNILNNFKNCLVKKININKNFNTINIFLESNKIIEESIIEYLRETLTKEFQYLKVNLNINYNLENYSLKNKLEKYWPNILYLVEKKSKLCSIILKNSSFIIEETNIIIKTNYNGSFFCNKLDLSNFIKNIFFEKFSVNINVLFKDDKDFKINNKNYFSTIYEKEKEILIEIDNKNNNLSKENKKLPYKEINKVKLQNKLTIKDKIEGNITKLQNKLEINDTIIFQGNIFHIEIKETKNDSYLISFDITDKTDSITVKFFINIKDYNEEYKKIIKKDNNVLIKGKVRFDNFTKEINIMAIEICQINETNNKNRIDNYNKKRVELNLHTQMSTMDGITPIKYYIEKAIKWGHKAIAVTDHGVLQSFPEAMEASKNKNIKIIYGIEAYLVDDLKAVVQSLAPKNENLDDEFVIFDIETTGLNKETDLIIEIGAIKIKNGKIIDTFSSFIGQEVKLSQKIIDLTSITDEMLKDQPKEKEVIKNFLHFINKSILVAHNANFDVGFISISCFKLFGKKIENTIIDTVELSRTLLPKLNRYKLNIVAKHLSIELKNHHRAIDDAKATAEIFIKFIEMLKNRSIYYIKDINKLASKLIDKSRLKIFHAVILVKNYTGLRNLYELVSDSHIKYFFKYPRIPKSEFLKLKDGLIIGSSYKNGEIFNAVLDNKPKDYIKSIINFYDYFEIEPLDNNITMPKQNIIDINKKIIELGDKYNKLVVATGNVHFLDKEDDIYRKIIMNQEGFKNADIQPPLYFKTTEEMLAQFSYLNKEKAEEIVIDNTNKISNMIENIKPIPDEIFPPKIEGAEDELKNTSINRAKEIYGENLPKIVSDRLEKELYSIIKNGFAVMYIIAKKLVWKSLNDGYLVGSRGSVGSSFVATMAKITEVNPLSAHYICPSCKYSDFDSETVKNFLKNNQGGSGYDMPDMLCPNCNTPLNKDGHDIPFETFLGFNGDKEPDIDLNFSGEYQNKAHLYIEELFGKNHVFKAGTIGTIADKTAYCYVKKYMEEKNLNFRNAELNRIKLGCTGIKRTTGQHPGGLMIVPKNNSIYEFTPIQKPANDTKSNIITTHFDYHSISGRLLKLDILGHDVPTIIRMLQDTTGIDPQKINLGDKNVISLFTDTKILNLEKHDIDCNVGTLGLPEFGTSFVRKMLIDTKPETFGELVRISGLSHGTDVWFNNAQDLIKNKICTLKEIIPTRDDIMVYLISHGMEKQISFKIMENVRKGKGITLEEEEIMKRNNIPEWYIISCKKIKYMFPKGHAVAYVMMAVRIAYFKIYYPYSFYAAIFSVKIEDFDYELMCLDHKKVKDKIKLIKNIDNPTLKEKNMLTILEIVNEMYYRNLKFIPLNLYEADSKKFKVFKNGIMPPLCSIQGLGETVAQNIIKSRKHGEFISIEEFRERTKATKTVIELLKKNFILDNIPETNQLTLF